MKLKNTFSLAVALCTVTVATGSSEESAPQNQVTPPGQPVDYFPAEIGRQFRYNIELGEVEPLRFEKVTWPNGNGSLTYATRGLMRGLIEQKNTSTNSALRLELTVKARVAKQGPFSFPGGMALRVDRDDLGFFDGAKEVYWGITRGSDRVMLVVPHDPSDSPVRGSWGSWDVDPGYSVRVVFFAEKPFTSIGLGRESEDTLLFNGIDPKPPITGGPFLHFVREVKANERTETAQERSYLDNGFAEAMWFAKNRGLVRLHQKIGGKTSMIWTLEK